MVDIHNIRNLLILSVLLLFTVGARCEQTNTDNAVIVVPPVVNLARSLVIPIYIRMLPQIPAINEVTLSTDAGYFSAADQQSCTITLKPGGVANTALKVDNLLDTKTIAIHLTLKFQEQILALNEVTVVKPERIILQEYDTNQPADGSTIGRISAFVLDNRNMRLAHTPVMMITDVPGKNSQLFVRETDSLGCVTFDIPASVKEGFGYVQLRSGSVESARASIQYFTTNIQATKLSAKIVVPDKINNIIENGIPVTVVLSKINKDANIPTAVTIVASEGAFTNSKDNTEEIILEDGVGYAILYLNPLSNLPVTMRVLLKDKAQDGTQIIETIGTNIVYKKSYERMTTRIIPLGTEDQRNIAGIYEVTVVDNIGNTVSGVPVILFYTVLNDRQHIAMQLTDENGYSQFPIPIAQIEGKCTYQVVTEYYANKVSWLQFNGDGRIIGWGDKLDDDGIKIQFDDVCSYDLNGKLSK